MAGNVNLTLARVVKNDEFYTRYEDVEKEVSAYVQYSPEIFRNKTILLPCDNPELSNFTKFFIKNFEKLGMKKLISTSFQHPKDIYQEDHYPTLFHSNDNPLRNDGNCLKGKILSLEKPFPKTNTDESIINLNKTGTSDCPWRYLEGDGDFRSAEITKLRDQSDVIITNPPFSLFREFLTWIMDGGKRFLIIGNLNAVTYKEVFPLIKENKIWMGSSCFNGGAAYFIGRKEAYDRKKMSKEKHAFIKDDQLYWRVNGVRWFTNLDHEHRHQLLQLSSMKDNPKFKSKFKDKLEFNHYDNYDAIEIPFIDLIPNDYNGIMGVPISFFDKYCPEQFEILGCSAYSDTQKFGVGSLYVNNKKNYARILIRRKN